MKWSNIKNIVLLILILANAFLLFVLGYRQQETAGLKTATAAELEQVLANSGISFDNSLLPESVTFSSLWVERDLSGESAIASALLGAAEQSVLGGGVYAYEGPAGSATFRSNGEFEIVFDGGLDAAGADKHTHAETILRQMQFDPGDLHEEGTEDGRVLTYRQTKNDMVIFGCTAVFTYEGERLMSVTGRRLLGQPLDQGVLSGTMTSMTALFRCFQESKERGDVYTEIVRVEAGYQLTGALELVAVFRVETDTGAYLVAAVTGTVERENL